MKKGITIKLDEDFAKALRYYKKHDPHHRPMAEIVRWALIIYWTKKDTTQAALACEVAMGTPEASAYLDTGEFDEELKKQNELKKQ